MRRVYMKVRRFFFKLLSSKAIVLKGRFYRNCAVLLEGRGTIEVGTNVQLGCFPSPEYFTGHAYLEARGIHSVIRIGSNTTINNAAKIIADKGVISIGADCLVGINVFITDSDFHGLGILDRRSENYECKNVNIGNNVFIGNNVTILKGVTIGDNCVIATGAVVTKSFIQGHIIGGTPAKIIGEI